MSPSPIHALLLCAGLGSRLLPLTADRPKCLIEVGGRAILDHQVSALRAAGIDRITVVGGYRIEQLAAFVADRWAPAQRPRLVFNPFYAVANSIGSVWIARDVVAGPFVLINGDTVYDPALVADGLVRLAPGLNLFVEPVTTPTDDDMLVKVDGDLVTHVGKTLDPGHAAHRSLGFIATADADGADYSQALAEVIAAPGGADAYHHAVVDRLAEARRVSAVSFAGGAWTEIDRPGDIAGWSAPPEAANE